MGLWIFERAFSFLTITWYKSLDPFWGHFAQQECIVRWTKVFIVQISSVTLYLERLKDWHKSMNIQNLMIHGIHVRLTQFLPPQHMYYKCSLGAFQCSALSLLSSFPSPHKNCQPDSVTWPDGPDEGRGPLVCLLAIGWGSLDSCFWHEQTLDYCLSFYRRTFAGHFLLLVTDDEFYLG